MLQKCDTKYLFFIDSDILFFGNDLISQCVDYMEKHPECMIFSSDDRYENLDRVDPHTFHEAAIASWFFCVRTELREKVSQSFLIRYPHEQPMVNGMKIVSDTGAKVLKEMKKLNLEMHILPWTLRQQFYHFGNLSWLYMVQEKNRWTAMKHYQVQDLKKRAHRLRHFL